MKQQPCRNPTTLLGSKDFVSIADLCRSEGHGIPQTSHRLGIWNSFDFYGFIRFYILAEKDLTWTASDVLRSNILGQTGPLLTLEEMFVQSFWGAANTNKKASFLSQDFVTSCPWASLQIDSRSKNLLAKGLLRDGSHWFAGIVLLNRSPARIRFVGIPFCFVCEGNDIWSKEDLCISICQCPLGRWLITYCLWSYTTYVDPQKAVHKEVMDRWDVSESETACSPCFQGLKANILIIINLESSGSYKIWRLDGKLIRYLNSFWKVIKAGIHPDSWYSRCRFSLWIAQLSDWGLVEEVSKSAEPSHLLRLASAFSTLGAAQLWCDPFFLVFRSFLDVFMLSSNPGDYSYSIFPVAKLGCFVTMANTQWSIMHKLGVQLHRTDHWCVWLSLWCDSASQGIWRWTMAVGAFQAQTLWIQGLASSALWIAQQVNSVFVASILHLKCDGLSQRVKHLNQKTKVSSMFDWTDVANTRLSMVWLLANMSTMSLWQLRWKILQPLLPRWHG